MYSMMNDVVKETQQSINKTTNIELHLIHFDEIEM